MLKAQWLWRSTRDGRSARRKYEDAYLLHRHLPAAHLDPPPVPPVAPPSQRELHKDGGGGGGRVARMARAARAPKPKSCATSSAAFCAASLTRWRRLLRRRWGSGQLSGIWLGLWASASGGAAQSASLFMRFAFPAPNRQLPIKYFGQSPHDNPCAPTAPCPVNKGTTPQGSFMKKHVSTPSFVLKVRAVG